MDGVIYRGGEVIPGAVEFVRRLRETDTPFLFLTNNSQRTRRDVATKLCRMGIDTTEDDVFTCAMEADILGGVQLGFRTVLVLSGGTKISDLANFAYQPDMIVNDCGEIELDQVFTGNCWNVGLLS